MTRCKSRSHWLKKLRSSINIWFRQTSSQAESSGRSENLSKPRMGHHQGGKGSGLDSFSVNQGTTSLGLPTAFEWNPQGSRKSVRPKQSWPEAQCTRWIRKLSRHKAKKITPNKSYRELRRAKISCSHSLILVMSSFSLISQFSKHSEKKREELKAARVRQLITGKEGERVRK